MPAEHAALWSSLPIATDVTRERIPHRINMSTFMGRWPRPGLHTGLRWRGERQAHDSRVCETPNVSCHPSSASLIRSVESYWITGTVTVKHNLSRTFPGPLLGFAVDSSAHHHGATSPLLRTHTRSTTTPDGAAAATTSRPTRNHRRHRPTVARLGLDLGWALDCSTAGMIHLKLPLAWGRARCWCASPGLRMTSSLPVVGGIGMDRRY